MKPIGTLFGLFAGGGWLVELCRVEHCFVTNHLCVLKSIEVVKTFFNAEKIAVFAINL